MSVSKLFDLSGKVAIVTGGGNGIGKACCETLAEAGAAVAVSDLKLEDARQVADGIVAKGGKAIAVACNPPFHDLKQIHHEYDAKHATGSAASKPR